MAKLNNPERMRPFDATFTPGPGQVGMVRSTRIWAESMKIARGAAQEMVGCDSWGIGGYRFTVGAVSDKHLRVLRTDVVTSCTTGCYEFAVHPVVDYSCLDADDLREIGSEWRAKQRAVKS